MVSVIIPVYNTIKYLDKCVNSLLNQSFQDIEIVLVDDGSNDGSDMLCDKLAEKDSRIKAVHQPNQGPGVSRKVGFSASTGEYVTFVDSDDWVDQDYLETLFRPFEELSQDVDIVVSGMTFEKVDASVKVQLQISEGIYEHETLKNGLLSKVALDYKTNCQGMSGSACAKLFRREILEQTTKDLDTSIKLGEDRAMVYPGLFLARKIVVLAYYGYHYYRRPSSAMHNLSLSSFEDAYKLHNYLNKVFDSMGIKDLYQDQLDAFTIMTLSQIISTLFGFEIQKVQEPFQFFDLPAGKRIVIYGAGDLGRKYYRELTFSKYAEIIAWVDKREPIWPVQMRIDRPEVIRTLDFDYILIAAKTKRVANEMIDNVVDMGVSKEKCVWRDPEKYKGI